MSDFERCGSEEIWHLTEKVKEEKGDDDKKLLIASVSGTKFRDFISGMFDLPFF